MKVAVSAFGAKLEAQVDPRFGRCQFFVIVDIDSMAYEAMPNLSADAMNGAGIQAVQALVEKGVQAVITGSVGPNALQVLSFAGIKIMTGASGTVREAVEIFKKSQLQEATSLRPRGFGLGRGMGGGKGMGRRFLAMPYLHMSVSPSIPPPFASGEEEIAMLRVQINSLQQQREQIKRRLDELKGSSSR